MAAPVPAASLANLLTLPARHFAVVDAGRQRARIVFAAVSRGRPRYLRHEIIDSHEEGFTTPEELREEVRVRLLASAPEAVVLVMPQSRILRHVLEIPPGDTAHTRTAVEREASRIGGLSDSPWVFDAVRLASFGDSPHPVAAAFCRQSDLQEVLDAYVEDDRSVYDVRPAGEALAAAFTHAVPALASAQAILVDLGASSTSVTILVAGQTAFASSFPTGSAAFTDALAADRGGTRESAEVLKRTEPSLTRAGASPRLEAALEAWRAELERTLAEWQADHPKLASASWPVYLAGGGALQPGLAGRLSELGSRPFLPWPAPSQDGRGPAHPDLAVAWGALLLALGLGRPAPSLLPPERRAFWDQQRVWRGLLSVNLALIAMLAVAVTAAAANQSRLLADKAAWKRDATAALQRARDIRIVSEGFNARMDAFRPVLERQRQTVETLQVLAVLQRQRTNANHWYVLLADGLSYAAGSNHFAAAPALRPSETRFAGAASVPATNPPPSPRAFVAEVCLVPQGEQMRQALSDLVGDLKRFPLFRNVDVLPTERRRDLVATNLVFADRHFALELNLSEAELLPPFPLPRLSPTNREPRAAFRVPLRGETVAGTNGSRSARPR